MVRMIVTKMMRKMTTMILIAASSPFGGAVKT